jgi:hypothetical protein
MSMTLTLYCVARGRGAEWEAFCLDFDLAVQGRSADEVVGRLKAAIAQYIDSAMNEPEPIRSQLLNRHVPFWTTLMWRLRVAHWALTGSRKKAEESTFGFPVPCHA